MSKIFEKNLIVETVRGYWKQCAGLVTGFVHRYRFDFFFRTEFNTIGLQILFSAIILMTLTVAFSYLYRDMALSLLDGIERGPTVSSSTIPGVEDQILGKLKEVKTRNLLAAGTIIMLITALFGYIIARMTLRPTRNALSAQKQFIGNVAHELRTPLSTIKTNTEVALLDPALDPNLSKALRSNIEELDRVSDIINNLLSFNTFVRPERIEFSDVDLNIIVTRVVKKLSPLLERKRLQLSVRKSEFCHAWGNESALEQVVTNLLKNAIAYTSENGQISVTIEPNYHGYMILSIQDSGIGIAEKDLFRIFEPFYRADQSRARRLGGSGLGLAIVNELVKLHHGKISIRSALKRGTTVTISLPCGVVDEHTDALQRRPETGHDRERRGEITIDFSHGKHSQPKKHEGFPPTPNEGRG